MSSPAAEVVRRALAWFDMADDEARRALSRQPDEFTPEERFQRARDLAAVAAAGARVAHAMTGAEHVEFAREVETKVEQRAEGFQAAVRGLADDDQAGRDGYLVRLERWRDDIADAARVALDPLKAPDVQREAVEETRRLIATAPYPAEPPDGE